MILSWFIDLSDMILLLQFLMNVRLTEVRYQFVIKNQSFFSKNVTD